MSETFADAFTEVQGHVQEVLRLDAGDLDPEESHACQERAAETALRWIAENSVDLCSRHLAAEVLKAIDSDGKRW
jgi:hypothetical protein